MSCECYNNLTYQNFMLLSTGMQVMLISTGIIPVINLILSKSCILVLGRWIYDMHSLKRY